MAAIAARAPINGIGTAVGAVGATANGHGTTETALAAGATRPAAGVGLRAKQVGTTPRAGRAARTAIGKAAGGTIKLTATVDPQRAGHLGVRCTAALAALPGCAALGETGNTALPLKKCVSGYVLSVYLYSSCVVKEESSWLGPMYYKFHLYDCMPGAALYITQRACFIRAFATLRIRHVTSISKCCTRCAAAL